MTVEDSIRNIEQLISDFASERDWDQFHSPKNLLLALVGEVGELAELLQWKTESETIEFIETSVGKQRISEEIADVAIYLIRLCQKTDVNIIEAIQNKIELNSEKYPIAKSKGNSKKYTGEK